MPISPPRRPGTRRTTSRRPTLNAQLPGTSSRCYVSHDQGAEKTSRIARCRSGLGGREVSDTANEKRIKGDVIASAMGKPLASGEVRTPDVKVGDAGLIGKYAGTEIKIEEVEYPVFGETDIDT